MRISPLGIQRPKPSNQLAARWTEGIMRRREMISASLKGRISDGTSDIEMYIVESKGRMLYGDM